MSEEYIDINKSDLELWISWPPSVNNYYSHTRYGVHLSAGGRKYRDAISRDLGKQLGGRRLKEGSLSMLVVLFPPDRRKRDLDNHMKGLLDSLQAAGLIIDDEWIDELRIVRGEVVKGGSAYVKISAGVGWEREDELDEEEGIDEMSLRGIGMNEIKYIV